MVIMVEEKAPPGGEISPHTLCLGYRLKTRQKHGQDLVAKGHPNKYFERLQCTLR